MKIFGGLRLIFPQGTSAAAGKRAAGGPEELDHSKSHLVEERIATRHVFPLSSMLVWQ